MIKKNMLIAFLLNVGFTIIEIVGGIFTNSISILSDSLHDFGDSLSIGLALLFEKKAEKSADKKYTYGYVRYSVLGAFVTTVVLLIGSFFIIFGAINRIIHPEPVVSLGVFAIAVLGVIVNGIACFATSKKGNINQKAISLHLLEDVLGWVIFLIGGLVMYFTNWYIIDPILSLLLAVFILFNVFVNLKMIFNIFLQKTPSGFDIQHFRDELLLVNGVLDIYHIHVWTLDGNEVVATFHVKLKQGYSIESEQQVKNELKEKANVLGVGHTTIEIDDLMVTAEKCMDTQKLVDKYHHGIHHHH